MRLAQPVLDMLLLREEEGLRVALPELMLEALALAEAVTEGEPLPLPGPEEVLEEEAEKLELTVELELREAAPPPGD